ncbi:MAG: hypothetical protein KDD70_13085, partial [Bdellovibrionales bacterium]|nr:hypothetical protein [Bdellovibrionales bacterium]
MSPSLSQSSFEDLEARFSGNPLLNDLSAALQSLSYDMGEQIPIEKFLREASSSDAVTANAEKVQALSSIPRLLRALREGTHAENASTLDCALPEADRADELYDTAHQENSIRVGSLGSVLIYAAKFFGSEEFTASDYQRLANPGRYSRIDFRNITRCLDSLSAMNLASSDGSRYRLDSRVAALSPSDLVDLCKSRLGDSARTLGWSFKVTGETSNRLRADVEVRLAQLAAGESLEATHHLREISIDGGEGRLLKRHQRVFHPDYGIGTVKFINATDSTVHVRFQVSTPSDIRIPREDLPNLRPVDSEEQSNTILTQHQERSIDLADRWTRAKAHVHPSYFHKARDTVKEILRGETISFQDAKHLEESLSGAEERRAQQGETILGFDVFTVLIMHRELTDPKRPRMVVDAARIVDRFSSEDFERFVTERFDGDKCKQSFVEELAERETEYIRDKARRAGYSVALEEAQQEAAKLTASSVSMIERCAHAMKLVPNPINERQDRFEIGRERYQTLE